MISTRRRIPRLSLDDLVDELIDNPTEDDTQLIGDVRADNAKSSRMVKGQADLLELNAWIDNHNELPSLDSSDFTERKLARRMNGYAHAAAEHADLKPFDKHDLIDSTLYQKPAPIPDLFFEDDISAYVDVDTPLSLDLGDVGDSGLSAEHSEAELASTTDDYESMVVEVVEQAKVGDDSFIDSLPNEECAWLASLESNNDTPLPSPAMDELPSFDVTEPLSTISSPAISAAAAAISSPAISAAAAAIIKLRARKQLLAERALLDSDIDAALASDSVSSVTDRTPPATKLTDISFITNPTKAIGAGRHDVVSTPLEAKITSESVIEPVTALEPQFEVQAHAEPVVGANHVADLPVEVDGKVAVDSTVITAAQIGMEGRTINPSYMSVLYQATPNAKSYDDISYVKKHTPYILDEAVNEVNGDDIDALEIPFANIPLADQLPANYHDNLIDYYGITGISEDDLLASNSNVNEALPLMVEDDLVATPVVATAPSADDVEPSIIDTTYQKPAGKYGSTPVYWSIDGEYDLDIVNSDYATGLTQRHNPNPPMTATKPNSTPNPNSTSVADTSGKPSPRVAAANPPQAGAKPTTTKPSAAAGTTDTDDGFSLTATASDNITTSKPTSTNKPVEREVEAVPEFASLDDILADDDDFLSSLCLEEDHLFDLESKYTDVDGRATADEIGKQTPCEDFYMYEAHFKMIHDQLESKELKTVPHTMTNLKEGDAFILDGMIGFVQHIGEYRENYAGVYDPRLRLIFDNGTESNILRSTLAKRFSVDKTGQRIIRSADDFTDFDNLDRPTKIRTGQVYIVRSLSNDPALKQIPNLYKIGFTKGTVEERTKNALRDTAFLESPIEVVTKAECYDLDPRGLEGLIHDFLHSQRINITLTSKNGSQYHPQEWFSVGLDEAKKVITHIVDGTIVDYRMDNTTNRVVAK